MENTFHITPIGYANDYKCYYCGADKSVKYFAEVVEPTEGSEFILVPCCNKCALQRIIKGDVK